MTSLVKPESSQMMCQWDVHSTVITHLHSLAVKEEDVWLLLCCTLADQQEEGWEVFFRIQGIAAVDGFERVALQLFLNG